MKKKILILYLVFSFTEAAASIKGKIIKNLENTKNLTFNFEQNINGKTEDGSCALSYPQKIFCKYNLKNKKILVSNGKSLVIKTANSYYLYPIERTPLKAILSKNFLLKKIKTLDERIIDNKFINFQFSENDYNINIFFDNKTYNLIGWQTTDIYQNLSITFLSSVEKNKKLNDNLFVLPKQN